MNTNSVQKPRHEILAEFFNSASKADDATDPSHFIKMAAELLSGKADPCGVTTEYLMQIANLTLEKANQLALELTRGEWGLSVELCEREDATPEFLDFIANWEDWIACSSIAHNPNTRIATLIRLARSSDNTIACCGLWSGRLPPEILDEFINDTNQSFRCAVAYHSPTPETLKLLAVDSDSVVRSLAVKNPHIDIAVINEVALNETDLAVLVGATRRTTDQKALERVSNMFWEKRDKDLGDAIAQNEHAPAAIRVAAELGSNQLEKPE